LVFHIRCLYPIYYCYLTFSLIISLIIVQLGGQYRFVQDTKNIYFYGSILRTYLPTYPSTFVEKRRLPVMQFHGTRVFCFPPDIHISVLHGTAPRCRKLASSDRIADKAVWEASLVWKYNITGDTHRSRNASLRANTRDRDIVIPKANENWICDIDFTRSRSLSSVFHLWYLEYSFLHHYAHRIECALAASI